MNSPRTFLAAALIVACAAANPAPPSALAQQAATPPPAPAADPPAPKERFAAVKKSFTESQVRLRTYEWIETTVVSLKAEEKSRTQNRCYYGAEGKITKVAIAPPPEEKPGRGLRGRIKEKKKEELADYMQEASELVHEYLPPDHEKLQLCADAGKVTIHIIEPDKRAKVEFHDYFKPGDVLSVEINLADDTILGASVASTLKNKDPVTLEMRFEKFPDGTIYTAETKLKAEAKGVEVNVQNSGYRELGS